jgi:hypothetical protein
MAKLRKGGPKRKEGARDHNGRLLPEDDPGTPELLARKFAATGSTREELSALGVLRGRKIIDEYHYEAGQEFERCYRAYIGRPEPRGSSLEHHDRSIATDLDDSYMARMKIRYWNCLAALKQISPHAFSLVRDVCLFERTGGLIGHVIAYDIVRVEGLLISRKEQGVPPPLRQRIAALVRGLEALDTMPQTDYSAEADRLIATLRARATEEAGQRNDSA